MPAHFIFLEFITLANPACRVLFNCLWLRPVSVPVSMSVSVSVCSCACGPVGHRYLSPTVSLCIASNCFTTFSFPISAATLRNASYTPKQWALYTALMSFTSCASTLNGQWSLYISLIRLTFFNTCLSFFYFLPIPGVYLFAPTL